MMKLGSNPFRPPLWARLWANTGLGCAGRASASCDSKMGLQRSHEIKEIHSDTTSLSDGELLVQYSSPSPSPSLAFGFRAWWIMFTLK